MPSTCTFEFDRPDPVYISGEIVNGRITLHTTKEKSVKGIFILLAGVAKVRWQENKTRQQNGKTHHYTVNYRGDETYLQSQTIVFGNGKLPAGTHVYSFSVLLPLQCPTSCTERHGKIVYEVSLTVERSFRWDNVFTQPLTVLRQLDLNANPQYLLPLTDEDIKYFCCWPCSSGPVISTLTIPFGGYAPGQGIKYKLQVDNQSHGYDIHGLKLSLKQIYNFTAHTPQHKTRQISNTLTRLEQDESCLRLSKRLIQGTLTIPAVPPTTVDGSIIKVSYYIDLSIRTGDCHSDSEVQIPITIGTIPLAQSATNPSHITVVEPTAPYVDTDSLTGTTDKPPSYDICMPPTFEEATAVGEQFVDTDGNDFNRHVGWLPKYPMYTNFAVPRGGSASASAPPYTFTDEEQQTVDLLPLMSASSNANTASGSATCPYPLVNLMPQIS